VTVSADDRAVKLTAANSLALGATIVGLVGCATRSEAGPTLTTLRASTTVPVAVAVPLTTAPPVTAGEPPERLPYTVPSSAESCDPNYADACVPIADDVDCVGGSGNGPAYVGGPVQVVGHDIYGLDRDNDGVGCE
jgi:hypothetical protein